MNEENKLPGDGGGCLVAEAGGTYTFPPLHKQLEPVTDIIGLVDKWNLDAGRTQGHFNVRNAAFYLGMQCEELAEKLQACGMFSSASMLDALGNRIKNGELDMFVRDGDRKAMLDADCDLMVVTIGSAQGIGSNFKRAMDKVIAANEAKRFPDGTLHRNEQGKILKPEGWAPPDLTDCLSEE